MTEISNIDARKVIGLVMKIFSIVVAVMILTHLGAVIYEYF